MHGSWFSTAQNFGEREEGRETTTRTQPYHLNVESIATMIKICNEKTTTYNTAFLVFFTKFSFTLFR